MPSSFSQNFHLRFFEEQKRPSGPPNERFLRRVIYFFFRPQSQRRVVPSLRFSARLPSVFFFPKVCFSRAFVPLSRAAPRFYAPFLLSCPLRFLTPLCLCSSFLENCPFSSPLFFPRVLIPLASIFTLFKTLFSEPFPALCFFQVLSSLTPLSISFFLPFSSSFFLPFSSRLPAIFLFVATLPYSNRLYSLRRGSSIKGIKTEFCTYRYSSLMRILSSSRSK